MDNSNDVKGSGDYVNVRLGTIYNDVEISADYGSLSIEKMAANAGNVSVKSDYMPITIGLDPGYNFEFDISLSYAKLKGADGFNMEQKREESRKRYYLGNRGGANTSNRILITSDYGNVTFKTN